MGEQVKTVHTERIFVTSALARQYMKANLSTNRPINEERVNGYARDMKGSRWKENGDTIKFAVGGALIDGQHRLQACIQCGIGFWSLVAYGIEESAFVTIDRNQTRSVGQTLRMTTGIEDYNAISATLTWLWRFKDGIMQTNPQIQDSVTAARQISRRFKAGSVATVAICHYLFTRQDATLAEAFFDALATGASLREIDPVYQLRARIISSASSTVKRIGSHELIALYFKAWIAEREQRTMSILRWMETEAFPNIGPLDGSKHRPDKIVKALPKPTPKQSAKSPSLSRLDNLIQKHQGGIR